MMTQPWIETVRDQAAQAAEAIGQAAKLKQGQVVVIGCSTSEVLGERIGTAGTLEVAEALFDGLQRLSLDYGVHLAFQCCEHLNRALVVERACCNKFGWTEVSAVPVPRAGGSMAACAYQKLQDACLVEEITAHAGIDIGETLIGMHLKRVAIPLRTSVKAIGHAHVAMAATRPKLIGGVRAVYEAPVIEDSSANCK